MSTQLFHTPHLDLLTDAPRIAIAVSGGADSMALAHWLRATFPDKEIFAYTVDHGLRKDSDAEATQVATWLKPHMHHTILTWGGTKPKTGIQEAARQARYDMLAAACRRDGVPVLCTAHHADDQAETMLHRLAKGSGLDGLAGIKSVSEINNIKLLRPFLHVTHDDLVAYCRSHNIAWVEDPSNENSQFARVRLRNARAVLEEEGLTNERLGRLASRLGRAKEALDYYTDEALKDYCSSNVIAASARKDLPEEIILRMVLKIADHVAMFHTLRSHLKQLEDLLEDKTPRRVTLGHTILTFREDGGIQIQAENAR